MARLKKKTEKLQAPVEQKLVRPRGEICPAFLCTRTQFSILLLRIPIPISTSLIPRLTSTFCYYLSTLG